MSSVERKLGGAPKGNRNAVKSGVYSFLSTGKYPRGASYIGRLVGQLRHTLEAVVLDRDGEVSVYDAALIQSASRHEGRAQLLQRWLRELDKVNANTTKKPPSIQDRVAILREIGNATDARDRCLKSLGLHERPDDDENWPTITVSNTQGEPANADVPRIEASPPKELASKACENAPENAVAETPAEITCDDLGDSEAGVQETR